MRTAAIFALVGAISATDCTKGKDKVVQVLAECTSTFNDQCSATTTKAAMQVLQTTTQHRLDAATDALAAEHERVAALTSQHTAAINLVTSKARDMKNSDTDPTSVAYLAAEAAHQQAESEETAKAQALKTATAKVGDLTAKQGVLTEWVAHGAAYLTSTTSGHQTVWMTNNMAGQRLLKQAEAIQTANKSSPAYTKAGAIVLADESNQNTWHKNLLADANTVQNVQAILDADNKMPKTDLVKTWITKDEARLTTVKAAEAATQKAWTTAATAAAKDAQEPTKNTREKAGELAAHLKARYDTAMQTEAVSLAAMTAACTHPHENSNDCENLTAEYDNDKLVTAAAKEASATSATYFKTHYPVKTGATAGIIVGCIAVTICIAFGAYEYHAEKKQKELDLSRMAEEKGNEHSAMDMGATAEASINAAVGDGNMFFNDDCYTAMVDTEQ